MKAFISAIIASVVVVLAAATTAFAQTPPTHPTDPNAVLIATYQITISVSGGAGTQQQTRNGTMSTAAVEDECQIKANVNVWRTSTGQIDYVIDASSVQFVGNCDGVDMPINEIFGLLSTEALRRG